MKQLKIAADRSAEGVYPSGDNNPMKRLKPAIDRTKQQVLSLYPIPALPFYFHVLQSFKNASERHLMAYPFLRKK